MSLGVALAAIVLACAALCASASASGIVQANVTVGCPFAVTLGAQSVYTWGQEMNFTYTANTISPCVAASLSGNLTLRYAGNGTVAFSEPLSMNSLTQYPVETAIPPINSLPLLPDDYSATVAFRTTGFSNSSSKNFALVQGSNVVIISFSASTPVGQGDPVTFTANLINQGQLSTNSIEFRVAITGPVGYNISETAPGLAPNQTEQIVFTLNNVTGTAGAYSASANAIFATGNALASSAPRTASFTVTSSGGGGGGSGFCSGCGGSPPVNPTPQLSYTQLPYYTELQGGLFSLANLGMQNPSNVIETLTLSVPAAFQSLLTLETTNATLNPGQGLVVQSVFNSADLAPGVYTVPVNITVHYSGRTSVKTQYLTYVKEGVSTNATATRQVSYTTGGNAIVYVQIRAPSASSMTNATLITTLSPLLVGNLSQIQTMGLPAKIVVVGGVPQIDWLIPYLPANASVTVSYSVVNPSSLNLLERGENLFVQTSIPVSSSILRVVNMDVPLLYVDSKGILEVDALYTGTEAQNVTFRLSTPDEASIANPVQVVNASPNHLLSRSFLITTSNYSGTILMPLSITTGGATLNYTIPVVVLQRAPAPTTTIAQQVQTGGTNYAAVAAAAVIVVAGGWLLLFKFRWGGRGRIPHFDRRRELFRVREQIRMSDQGGAHPHEKP